MPISDWESDLPLEAQTDRIKSFMIAVKEKNIKSVSNTLKKIGLFDASFLHYAVLEGNIVILGCLFESGQLVSMNFSESGSVAKSRKVARINFLDGGPLAAFFSSHKTDLVMLRFIISHYHNAFHDVLQRDCRIAMGVDEIQMLIDAGLDINKPDKDGNLPLDLAYINDKKNLIDVLKHHGAVHASAEVRKGESVNKALWRGIKTNNLELVKLACENGADADERPHEGLSPLQAALFTNDVDIVREILDHGADINFKDIAFSLSPIQTYIASEIEPKKIDILMLLIERGAEVNTVDNEGTSLLHSAILNEDPEMIDRLIKAGVNLNMGDPDGKYPLDIALSIGTQDGEAIANLLKEAGAKESPNSMLSRASSQSPIDLALAEQAIHEGAQINNFIIDIPGADFYFNPLEYVLKYGNPTSDSYLFVKMLIDHGADVNVQLDVYPRSLIGLAIQRGDIRLTEMLIDAGADVNAYDTYNDQHGNSYLVHVLFSAVHLENNCEMIELLIDHNVKLNDISANMSVLDYAERNGKTNLYELLLDNGALDGRTIRDMQRNQAPELRQMAGAAESSMFQLTGSQLGAFEKLKKEYREKFNEYNGENDLEKAKSVLEDFEEYLLEQYVKNPLYDAQGNVIGIAPDGYPNISKDAMGRFVDEMGGLTDEQKQQLYQNHYHCAMRQMFWIPNPLIHPTAHYTQVVDEDRGYRASEMMNDVVINIAHLWLLAESNEDREKGDVEKGILSRRVGELIRAHNYDRYDENNRWVCETKTDDMGPDRPSCASGGTQRVAQIAFEFDDPIFGETLKPLNPKIFKDFMFERMIAQNDKYPDNLHEMIKSLSIKKLETLKEAIQLRAVMLPDEKVEDLDENEQTLLKALDVFQPSEDLLKSIKKESYKWFGRDRIAGKGTEPITLFEKKAKSYNEISKYLAQNIPTAFSLELIQMVSRQIAIKKHEKLQRPRAKSLINFERQNQRTRVDEVQGEQPKRPRRGSTR